MKTSKKLFTMLTAAAMTAAVTAAPISAAEVPVAKCVETKTGAGSFFTYTIKTLKNLAEVIVNDSVVTLKADEDCVITQKDGEDGDTAVYSVTVDAETAGNVDISYAVEGKDGEEYVPYIIRTENGKTLISSDDGKTWAEVDTEAVPEAEVQ